MLTMAQRSAAAWRVAMPTYYHRSVKPRGEEHPGYGSPEHSYFYTTESGDPHDVDWETRAYGDQVYSTELPEDVMEPDPAPRRTPGASWWRTDPANVGEMTHVYDPTGPFGQPRRRAWRVAAAEDALPPNMEFRLYDRPGMYGTNAAGVYYKNRPTGPNNWVSALTWRNGTIGHVETKPAHQGRGYASALHQWVKENHEPNLQHSEHLTDAGRGWAEKVGAAPHMHMPTDEAVQYAHWGLEPENESDYPGLYEHVAQHGVQTPLTIATDGVNAYLQDGYHRLDAAQKAGHPSVPVNVEHIHHADESESVPMGPHLKNFWHSRTGMAQRATNAWRLSGTRRVGSESHPPLPTLWNDYKDWHNEIHGEDDEYRPEHSVQSWGNVEEYLGDRHGIDPYDPNSFDHPVTLGMAKLHSLAQARPQVDGFQGRDDYLLNDDDLTTGAALGLLRIRKNRLTQQLEPVHRTAHFVDQSYDHMPRDEHGRIKLWRGAMEGAGHETFVPEPDPTGETQNTFHFRPPASWDEAEANLIDQNHGPNYGNYWGTEDEAKFYAGTANGAEPHGAMAVSAWFPREHVHDTEDWQDGVGILPGTKGEIGEAHVYHKGHGWVPLPDAPGKTVTA